MDGTRSGLDTKAEAEETSVGQGNEGTTTTGRGKSHHSQWQDTQQACIEPHVEEA